MNFFDQRGVIVDLAGGARILRQHTKEFVLIDQFVQITHDHFVTQWLGTGFDDADALWMYVGIDQKRIGFFRFRHTLTERHRFRCRGGFIQQRGVGQIQTGQVQIGERLLSGHQNENAVFGFDSVPFLAPSFDDSAKLFKAAKPKLDAVLDEQNLVMLYAVPWPPQGLYFNKEVNSAADMEGIKFRSYNNATARLAELTGMLPVTIEAAEISQAFATGVAESMISSGATGYDRKVWESLSHFYEVDAWLPYNYVMVNKGVWADVSDANKTAITTCAGEAQARGLQASKDYTQFTMDGLAAGGMTVGPAGDQLMGDLRAVGETMTAEWLEAAGDDGAAIVDGFKSMK